MNAKIRFVLAIFAGVSVLATMARAADGETKPAVTERIRVACVGASITAGFGTKDRTTENYAVQLQSLLGPRYEVHNFGVSGRTMLKRGDRPYWATEEYQQALALRPQIVVIDLGGNDSKAMNWVHQEDFATDARAMIDSYRNLETRPRVLLCLPMPAFKPPSDGINDEIITREQIPTLTQVAAAAGVELVDLHAPFVEKSAWFADGIHPNAEGARLMARIVGISVLGLADTYVPFTGDKITWHGFDRYDFLMDDATLSISPIKALDAEATNDGIDRTLKNGQRRCVVVAPKHPAPGNPWSWQGCYWNHQPQTEIELLKRGFHVAYVSVDPDRQGRPWEAWYEFLTAKHGLSRKPAFIGMSKGGFNEYSWAAAHPDKVSCIYADNPAFPPEDFALLGELAKQDVPLLHICGSADFLRERTTVPIEQMYHVLGGRITVMVKDGPPHHPHSLINAQPIADWIEANMKPTFERRPAFADEKWIKSYFYGLENTYVFLPEEKTYASCRGPGFTECYERYDLTVNSPWGATAASVVVPNVIAAGRPWIFRAGFIERDAMVDRALLAKGYHIVTAPIPVRVQTLRTEWDATYQLMVDHGFSRHPVLEGTGTDAGELYAWAEDNPDKVGCVLAQNPALRSLIAKTPPLENLVPLAKAAVPILHVCGSLDPWLGSETRALEKRYRELGGSITVLVREGEGHFPVGTFDVRPIVDFVTAHAE